MAGFARYTQNYNTHLKDTPFYRKGARGADPLKSFVAKSHVNYMQNASRIRDMRFAKSNELDKDYALRSKQKGHDIHHIRKRERPCEVGRVARADANETITNRRCVERRDATGCEIEG